MTHSHTTEGKLVIHMGTLGWVIVLAAVLVLFGVGLGVGHAATLEVDQNDSNCDDSQASPPQPYCTIQAAVDDANAGNTIEVDDGTYAPVVISGKDRLTLTDHSDPVIDCTVGPGNIGVDLVSTTGTTVQGFEITNCAKGIRLHNVHDSFIDDNVLDGNTIGILVVGENANSFAGESIQNVISDNYVEHSTSHGIVIQACEDLLSGGRNLFEDNELKNNGQGGTGWGLTTAGCFDVFRKNTAEGNASGGFRFNAAFANIVFHNHADNNTGDGFQEANPHVDVGLNLNVFVENSAEGNTRDGFRFVSTTLSRYVDNEAENNTKRGFLLSNVVGSVAANNDAKENTLDGFQLAGDSGSGNNLVANNDADKNGRDGYRTNANSAENAFTHNDSEENTGVGFRDASSGGTGTPPTDNIYTDNDCKDDVAGTSVPTGLCQP